MCQRDCRREQSHPRLGPALEGLGDEPRQGAQGAHRCAFGDRPQQLCQRLRLGMAASLCEAWPRGLQRRAQGVTLCSAPLHDLCCRGQCSCATGSSSQGGKAIGQQTSGQLAPVLRHQGKRLGQHQQRRWLQGAWRLLQQPSELSGVVGPNGVKDLRAATSELLVASHAQLQDAYCPGMVLFGPEGERCLGTVRALLRDAEREPRELQNTAQGQLQPLADTWLPVGQRQDRHVHRGAHQKGAEQLSVPCQSVRSLTGKSVQRTKHCHHGAGAGCSRVATCAHRCRHGAQSVQRLLPQPPRQVARCRRARRCCKCLRTDFGDEGRQGGGVDDAPEEVPELVAEVPKGILRLESPSGEVLRKSGRKPIGTDGVREDGSVHGREAGSGSRCVQRRPCR
mmetsp:Transcript_26806/g.76755  ORF Transcript_26806/g.76755 Transcript_26806/m.76755 type:complete len:395 (+) Transcript_26806:563-1747(+)